MAICMDTRPESRSHNMIDSYNPGEAFGSDFYRCLCEDLAKELDFPGETDLRRISQLELFGSSWETDPYQQLLLRCLDHTLPKLREQPAAIPRSRSFSVDYTDLDEENVEDDLEELLPTNPPPSPALSPTNYLLSSCVDGTEPNFDNLNESFRSMHMLGVPAEDDRLEPITFGQVHLLPLATDTDDMTVNSNRGLTAGEYPQEQRSSRPSAHRRVASTGLLATVVTGDGSVTWHFKKF